MNGKKSRQLKKYAKANATMKYTSTKARVMKKIRYVDKEGKPTGKVDVRGIVYNEGLHVTEQSLKNQYKNDPKIRKMFELKGDTK